MARGHGGGTFSREEIDRGRLTSALGYFPLCGLPMFILPLLTLPDNRYAQFHARQGAVLYVLFLVVAFGTSFVSFVLGGGVGIRTLLSIFYGAVLLLAVIGIVNALQGVAKDLPFIGTFSARLPF